MSLAERLTGLERPFGYLNTHLPPRSRLSWFCNGLIPTIESTLQQQIERVSREKTEFDFEHRLLMPDG